MRYDGSKPELFSIYVILADYSAFAVCLFFSLDFFNSTHKRSQVRSQDADRWPRLWRRTKEKQEYLCSLLCVLLSASGHAIFSRWLQLSVPSLSGALRATKKEKLFLVDKRWWWWWASEDDPDRGQVKWDGGAIHYSQPLALFRRSEPVRIVYWCVVM